MEYLTDFRDLIEVDRVEFFRLNPIPLPRIFKDGTGGVRTYSLFGHWMRIYDKDGNMGEGTCSPLALEFFAPILLSMKPMTLNEIREDLFWKIRNFGYQSAHVKEMGSVDFILLDYLARLHGQPLHRFLGAKKDYASVYKGGGSVLSPDEELVDDILRFKSEGYHQTKIKVAGFSDWRRDVERFEKVRKAVGDDFGIAVDANQGWDVETTFRFVEATHEMGLSWMEEPLHAYDMTGCLELSRRLSKAGIKVDIAMGESVRSYHELVQYAEHGVRHLNPVMPNYATVDEILKAKKYADEHGLMLSSGGFTFGNVAYGAVFSDHQLVEFHQPIMEVLGDYMDKKSEVKDGKWYLPLTPGLPVSFDMKKMVKDGLLDSVSYRYRQ
ncbi:MAG: hypothetical protein KBS81_07765 [Spirochaetales bacterium]|nr:hypothetical protein [Candidatus Physcosoma equi]